jgi:hypothetical protein
MTTRSIPLDLDPSLTVPRRWFGTGALTQGGAAVHQSPRSSRLLRLKQEPAFYPPIGARGLAPQKICDPIIPIRCTRTMFRIIDLAVALPTPTGPPEAV